MSKVNKVRYSYLPQQFADIDDLLLQIQGNLTNHQTYGTIVSKYLERMAKSNDQVLKLAELVSKEQEDETISSDDIFSEINSWVLKR